MNAQAKTGTTYHMNRVYNNSPIGHLLRGGYTDLEELMSFVPAYEGQGMAVEIVDQHGKMLYRTR